jgi:glyoxylase-like metal-dependent hydrolase (beta-lactamase superfamily II)
MKWLLPLTFQTLLLASSVACSAELTPGSWDVHWDGGAQTCPAGRLKDPIQIHRYNEQTFVLREKLCATWEAPFMYLLVGGKRALLIDTGDIADAASMPLQSMVMSLLPGEAGGKMPLLVAHSHGHLDHRAADPQFDHLAGVQLVLSDLPHVREYFHFADWPNGNAQIDLGDRIVDVLPAPGHHPAQLVFYDRNTGLVFSGDFLLPGRLLVDNFKDYEASAQRVANFLKDRPVSAVLGGHIEKDRNGKLLAWQSTDHPDEHVLQLSKNDIEALPAALQAFNGIDTETESFVIENPMRILIIVAVGALLLLILLGMLIYRLIRRRRRRAAAHSPK